MGKVIKISLLLLIALLVALSGCTVEDPGFVSVTNEPNVTLVDESGDVITVDATNNALVVIPYVHYTVHQGISFKVDTVDENMGNNDTLVIAFRTPPGARCIHIVVGYSTLLGGDLALWENPTWDNQSGTLLPIINRRREPSYEDSILLEDQGQATFVASNNLIANPTGLDLAGEGQILLHHLYVFGEEELGPGTARDEAEFILRADTQYAYVFTSGAGENRAWMSLNWYENES